MARRTRQHNDAISEGVTRRYADDPGYALELSQAARSRWNREYVAELAALNKEFEDGRLTRNLRIGLRVLAQALDNDGQLDDSHKKLLRAMREVGRSTMLNSAPEGHEPIRGSHSHTHAAHGHPVHEDGLHTHEHQHNNDNHHDQHPHEFGELVPGRLSGPGMTVDADHPTDGVYGRMNSTKSPLERHRLQNELRRQSEERR